MLKLSISISEVLKSWQRKEPGPVGPRWAPCCLHEPCHQGSCTAVNGSTTTTEAFSNLTRVVNRRWGYQRIDALLYWPFKIPSHGNETFGAVVVLVVLMVVAAAVMVHVVVVAMPIKTTAMTMITTMTMAMMTMMNKMCVAVVKIPIWGSVKRLSIFHEGLFISQQDSSPHIYCYILATIIHD